MLAVWASVDIIQITSQENTNLHWLLVHNILGDDEAEDENDNGDQSDDGSWKNNKNIMKSKIFEKTQNYAD